MKTRLTSTAWLQGIVNAMVCAVGVFGLLLVVGWLVSLLTNRNFAESTNTAFMFLWVALLLVFVVGLVKSFRNRGPLLLDCGGHPARWLFLAMAASLAIYVIRETLEVEGTSGSFRTLFLLSFSAYFVVMGMGRLGIYEHGIWTYCGLLKWNKIEKYSWANDGTFLLKLTGYLSMYFRGAIPVPEERVAAFKELLLQRLPSMPPT